MGWLKSEKLSKIEGVVHGFLDRDFGVDVSEAARLCGLGRIATLKQVHSNDVFVIRDGFREQPGQKGDALVTGLRSTGLGIFTADCVPLLFADKSATVVAAVHAGWRGTLSQIAKAALREMMEDFGIEPKEVCAVIGPSIGRCCYEIGEDVASLFMGKFEDSHRYLFKRDTKYVLDLKEANRSALEKEGVRYIDVVNVCTKCNAEFYSYRREGKAGTQLSFIGLL